MYPTYLLSTFAVLTETTYKSGKIINSTEGENAQMLTITTKGMYSIRWRGMCFVSFTAGLQQLDNVASLVVLTALCERAKLLGKTPLIALIHWLRSLQPFIFPEGFFVLIP